jgi:hypothetical protein
MYCVWQRNTVYSNKGNFTLPKQNKQKAMKTKWSHQNAVIECHPACGRACESQLYSTGSTTLFIYHVLKGMWHERREIAPFTLKRRQPFFKYSLDKLRIPLSLGTQKNLTWMVILAKLIILICTDQITLLLFAFWNKFRIKVCKLLQIVKLFPRKYFR